MFLLGRYGDHVDDPFPVKEGIHSIGVWAGNNLLSNCLVLPQVIRRLAIDVLFSQNFNPPIGRSRRVAHIHDGIFLSHPEYFTFNERLYLAPLRPLSNLGDAFITGAQSELERLRSLGFRRPGYVVPLACDERFRPATAFSGEDLRTTRDLLGLPSEYVLYVGRLNVRKNVDTLLRALPLMNNGCPLVVVGDKSGQGGGTAELLRAERNRVIVLSNVRTEHLPAVYALASAFCFPSLDEGFGLPPLEAMASGIPVVVSDVASLPEVCGDAAAYVNPHNAEEIAEQLDRVLTDSEYRQAKVSLGLERSRLFSWKRTANMIWDILTQEDGHHAC